jgi:hypothetical protein
MTVETQQGRRRARTPRPGEGAVTADTVLAGPFKDAATGRFLPGNAAARLRGLKRAPKLTTLNPAACAPWARPFVELAQREASELAAEVGAEVSASLVGFAEGAATAVAMHRAFLAIALAPDTPVETVAYCQQQRKRHGGKVIDRGPVNRWSEEGIESARELAHAHAPVFVRLVLGPDAWRAEWLVEVLVRGLRVRPDVAAGLILDRCDEYLLAFPGAPWSVVGCERVLPSERVEGLAVAAAAGGHVSVGALLDEPPAPPKKHKGKA